MAIHHYGKGVSFFSSVSHATATFAQTATLKRSIQLLNTFRYEQTQPERFYGPLGADSQQMVEALYYDTIGASLDGTLVLDVGGGPGYFAAAFEAAGAQYISVEPDVREIHAAHLEPHHCVRGSGMNLPFQENAFDIVFSSNVAEHVPHPWAIGEEMLRVLRPGGLLIYSYTLWLGPFGGHETGLWEHYVGGEFAARRYRRKTGHDPKNRFGISLFPISAQDGLVWARHNPYGRFVAAFPRYHPAWAWWMVRVPIVREFLVSNLVLVLQKK